MLHVTLFTTKKCDGGLNIREYPTIFFDIKNVLNEFFWLFFIGRAERLSVALLKKIS